MKRKAQISKGYGGILPNLHTQKGCDSKIFLFKKRRRHFSGAISIEDRFELISIR